MGTWYWIGVFTGIGAAIGLFGATGRNRPAAAVFGAGFGAVLAFAVYGWPEAIGGVVGALLGAFGAGPLVAGTLRRGGTRGGTAALLGGAALALVALAFVPVLGYLEALALPALGLRLRRRAPDTHAGLRTLTKD
jgi:hypothetical protein